MASIYCFPPGTFYSLRSRDWEQPEQPLPTSQAFRVNALLPFGSWKKKRRQIRTGEPSAKKAKKCLGLGGKAASGSHPAQVPSLAGPHSRAILLFLSLFHRDCFPVCPSFWTLLGVLGFSTAPGHGPCPRTSRPRPPPLGPPEVAAKPRAFSSPAAGPCAQRNLPGVQNRIARPGPRPSISWATCKCPRLPRTCSLGRGGPGAVWGAPWCGGPDGSHAKDARGAGPARWSQARRWRIFGAHCAA